MQLLSKSNPLKPYNFKGEGLGGKERVNFGVLSSCTVASTEPPASLAQEQVGYAQPPAKTLGIYRVGTCPCRFGDLCSDMVLLLQSQRCTFPIAASPSPQAEATAGGLKGLMYPLIYCCFFLFLKVRD